VEPAASHPHSPPDRGQHPEARLRDRPQPLRRGVGAAVIGAAVSNAAIRHGAELTTQLKGDASGVPDLRPLTDRLAVVELIGATTTKTGLKVESALDTRTYQKGIKVTKAQMKGLEIAGDQFHPEWNYTIRPRPP
jgi:anthranilate/para-aminobenzoate synthase component II